jgi:hypothetical protein
MHLLSKQLIFYSTVANSIAWILRILGLRYKTVRRTGHTHIGSPIQNNPKIIMKLFSKLVKKNPFLSNTTFNLFVYQIKIRNSNIQLDYEIIELFLDYLIT